MDIYRFLFNRYQGLDISRQSYKSWNIDWGSPNPVKTQYSRGLNDSEVVMNETVIVNSGFVNQPTFQWLEELWTSNDVYEIQMNGGLAPVNIINTEFELALNQLIAIVQASRCQFSQQAERNRSLFANFGIHVKQN
jgi:hypothetical protein